MTISAIPGVVTYQQLITQMLCLQLAQDYS